MRLSHALLAAGCLLSPASGQWLGEKLSLLDTFGIPAGHQSLAYNNRNRTVYLSGDGSDSILVIDANHNFNDCLVSPGNSIISIFFGVNPEIKTRFYWR